MKCVREDKIKDNYALSSSSVSINLKLAVIYDERPKCE